MRYYDSTWSELPTRMEEYTNGSYYYSATTSGFPYFAVTQKGTEVPTQPPTLVSLPTITQQVKAESTTIAATRTVNPVGDSHETIVTTTTTVPRGIIPGSPEIPTLWIVFGVAGFPGILIIVTVIRRWWIRRQKNRHCSGNTIN